MRRNRPRRGANQRVATTSPQEKKPVVRDKAYWESRFKKMPVTYKAQNGHPRDVRTFIFDYRFLLLR
jgi:hypothetical protein